VARIIQDHYDALEGMFDFIGGTRQLSTGYIKELAALLRNQDTYAVVDQLGRAFAEAAGKRAIQNWAEQSDPAGRLGARVLSPGTGCFRDGSVSGHAFRA
jgi:hypothetical protein